MKAVFADTSFFLASLNPDDELHQQAIALSCRVVVPRFTTAFVLVEVTNAMCRSGHCCRVPLHRVHFAIHHEPCFTGGLDRRFSGARRGQWPEHSDQFHLRHATVLSVDPVTHQVEFSGAPNKRRNSETEIIATARASLTESKWPLSLKSCTTGPGRLQGLTRRCQHLWRCGWPSLV